MGRGRCGVAEGGWWLLCVRDKATGEQTEVGGGRCGDALSCFADNLAITAVSMCVKSLCSGDIIQILNGIIHSVIEPPSRKDHHMYFLRDQS